jgi:G3E family GTPase
MNSTKKQIPVTIITGFLGSGKTTLVNRILTENHGKKYAVVLNEIGDVNLDSELVTESLGEDLKVMNNGCLCCTVRDDLSKIAKELLGKNLNLDGLVIETTGMADPTPVAQTFLMDESLSQNYSLDAIVTVVDSLNIEKNLIEIKETQEQIGFADVVLLNKIDLVKPEQIKKIEDSIRKTNLLCKVFKTEKSVVSLDEILNLNAFDIEKRSEINPELLKDFHDHTHDESIKSIYIEQKKPLDLEKLNRFMGLVVGELGEQILRCKGIVNVKDEPKRIVFQGVHMNIGSTPDRLWKENEERKTQMVFIGRHLPKDVLEEGLEFCTEN